MVGGGVRDLFAGVKPKDFDIATSAKPEQIRQLFRGCRLVGRRFMIAHVRMGPEIVEVTTFRGPITDSHERDETGRILSDNIYGTLEDDAFRRDFTINALYYDIRDYALVDYTGGLADIRAKTLRLIGDPDLRYREDPVRMLRAIRIGNKLHYRLAPEAVAPIKTLAPLLREIPPARLFDEVLKLLLNAEAVENFRALHWFGLWAHLFPDNATALEADPDNTRTFVEGALANTAERVRSGQTVSPSFLFAALLWPTVRHRAAKLMTEQSHPEFVALTQAGDEAFARQSQRIAVPKRFSFPSREIWQLQPRFDERRGGRPQKFLTHPRFRAAYDFLLLRAAHGEPVQELADWWTQAQAGQAPPPPDTDGGLGGDEPRRKRRRRRGGRNRSGSASPPPPTT